MFYIIKFFCLNVLICKNKLYICNKSVRSMKRKNSELSLCFKCMVIEDK